MRLENLLSPDIRQDYIFFDPLVLTVFGPPRSGKTEFARFLARRTNIAPVDIDEIRFWLFGRRCEVLPPEQEKHELEEAYRFMYQFASDRVVIDRSPVVLINTGSTIIHRNSAESFAREHRLPYIPTMIKTPEAVLRRRAVQPKAPHDYSNISTLEDIQRNIARMEKFSTDVVVIDGTKPIVHQVQDVVDHLVILETVPTSTTNLAV